MRIYILYTIIFLYLNTYFSIINYNVYSIESSGFCGVLSAGFIFFIIILQNNYLIFWGKENNSLIAINLLLKTNFHLTS